MRPVFLAVGLDVLLRAGSVPHKAHYGNAQGGLT